MSSELAEIDDSGVRAAFAEYGQEPGGEIRLDTAAIAVSGRRRVHRQRVVVGAAGAVAVAALVGGVATAQHLMGGDPRSAPHLATDKPTNLSGTGRDVKELFGAAADRPLDEPIHAGGAALALSRSFAGNLGRTPQYLDAAWQASAAAPTKPGVRWGLFTWTDGEKGAEGLLQVTDHPVYIAIYPPPYQSCGTADTADGRSCQVREVPGKGWLKVLRASGGKELRVYLQRVTGGQEQVSFTVRGGAVTRAKLAGGRQDLGALPVSEQDAVDAVLAVP